MVRLSDNKWDPEVLDRLLSLALLAPDLFPETIEFSQIKDDDGDDGKTVALKAAALEEVGSRADVPSPDGEMVSAWIVGEPLEAIWRKNKPSAGKESARMKGDSYAARIKRRFSWSYFGFMSILGYVSETEGIEISPEVQLFYRYLEEGVGDPISLHLVTADFGIGRTEAMAVSEKYPYLVEGTETEREVIEWLGGVSAEEMTDWLGHELGVRLHSDVQELSER